MAAKKTTKSKARKTRAPKAPKATEAETPPPTESEIQQSTEAEVSTPGETDVPTALEADVATVAEADVTQPREAEVLPTTETDLLMPGAVPSSTEAEVPSAGETDVPPPAEAEPPTDGTPMEAKPTRRSQRTKANDEPKAKKPSALDAAARVLGETGQPMTCPELIAAMSEKGYWTSPKGQTPHATLYAAILREINTKGADARFQKTERGRFSLRTTA